MQQRLTSSVNNSFKDTNNTRPITSRLSVAMPRKDRPNPSDLNPPLQVLIVDRDSMSSDLLASALAQDSRYRTTAMKAGDVLGSLDATQVDLVIIGAEFNVNGGNGLDLAYSISGAYKDISIVVLLNQTNRDSVIAAFRSGAHGVFSRQQSISELLECIEQVSRGQIWAGKQESRFLMEALRNLPVPGVVAEIDFPTLTTRELQVVRAAATGKTNRAIASDLGLSEHTIKNYLFKAFEKLGVSSRVELLFHLTVRGDTFDLLKQERSD